MGAATTATATIQGAVFSTLATDTGSNAQYSTAKSGSTVVRKIQIDNTAGSIALHTKIYNATAPTVGTSDPVIIIPVRPNHKVCVTVKGGQTLGTGATFATVQEAGTAGTTAGATSALPRVDMGVT